MAEQPDQQRTGRTRETQARAHNNGKRTQQSSQSLTATRILRDMVLSLLETGFHKQDIAAALGCLTDEAAGDHWQKAVDGRKHAKQMMRAAARRATARRKAAEKLFQD
jgi:hypothetical protein